MARVISTLYAIPYSEVATQTDITREILKIRSNKVTYAVEEGKLFLTKK
jgi:hypothetical protein